MSPDGKIRLLVVDDHEMVRVGLRALFCETEIQVVAEAATAAAAVNCAMESEIDVMLLDVRLPDGDGLSVLDRIKIDRPALTVVMFTAFDNPASVAKAVALGAAGYILKDCSRETLLQTVRTAAAGESAWNQERLRGVRGALRTPRAAISLEASLSEREAEVLRHMCAGMTNKQIAVAMEVSYETIKEHVQNLLRKLGLTDRTQAAVWAVRNGLV